MTLVRIQRRDSASPSAAELWPRIKDGLSHGYAGETRAGGLLVSHNGGADDVESALDQSCPSGEWRQRYVVMPLEAPAAP